MRKKTAFVIVFVLLSIAISLLLAPEELGVKVITPNIGEEVMLCADEAGLAKTGGAFTTISVCAIITKYSFSVQKQVVVILSVKQWLAQKTGGERVYLGESKLTSTFQVELRTGDQLILPPGQRGRKPTQVSVNDIDFEEMAATFVVAY